MFDPRSYLKDLGYSPTEGNPTLTELKKRWRDLCQEHHPDKGGSPEVFRRITHAYRMLTDLEYQHREMAHEMRTGKPNLKGDLNVRIDLKVPFEDVFFGRTMILTYSTDEYDKDFKLHVGKVEVVSQTLEIGPDILVKHNGVKELIFMCKGHRMAEHHGDTIVVVHTGRHPKFTVQAMDVYSEERIPLNLLLKGGTFDVMTMYGIQTAKINPGTQPGDKVRIPKCGVRKLGNHFVVVQPIFPTADELKGNDWRGLEINWNTTDDTAKSEESK